jgi:hypothetical protein
MLKTEDMQRFVRIAEYYGNDGNTYEEVSPVEGLSVYQAVEVACWCADQNAGRRNPERWFDAFNQCMDDAGYKFLRYRRGYWEFPGDIPRPPYPTDAGLVAVH